MDRLNAKDILLGYSIGIFPMADGKDTKGVHWIKPSTRGVIPVGKLHISKSLKKFIKSHEICSSLNKCFSTVVAHCANRPNTWINEELYKTYLDLHKMGHAYSIEIWDQETLIGGLFGITIGSCFFGESMFSVSKNGSKLALVVTMAYLRYNNFTLFDTQFITDHLKTMGACEISQSEYEELLEIAKTDNCEFCNFPVHYSWSEIIQLNNQKL